MREKQVESTSSPSLPRKMHTSSKTIVMLKTRKTNWSKWHKNWRDAHKLIILCEQVHAGVQRVLDSLRELYRADYWTMWMHQWAVFRRAEAGLWEWRRVYYLRRNHSRGCWIPKLRRNDAFLQEENARATVKDKDKQIVLDSIASTRFVTNISTFTPK